MSTQQNPPACISKTLFEWGLDDDDADYAAKKIWAALLAEGWQAYASVADDFVYPRAQTPFSTNGTRRVLVIPLEASA